MVEEDEEFGLRAKGRRSPRFFLQLEKLQKIGAGLDPGFPQFGPSQVIDGAEVIRCNDDPIAKAMVQFIAWGRTRAAPQRSKAFLSKILEARRR